MNNIAEKSESINKAKHPVHVRLPGFITDKEIGLGDVIKRATSYVGITPCAACEERARTLNNWVVFGPGHS